MIVRWVAVPLVLLAAQLFPGGGVAWLSPLAREQGYEGTQEAGGPVRLVMSGDGARIVLFEAEGVAGGGCSWDTITLDNWGGEIPVAFSHFEATNSDGDVLQGGWSPETVPPQHIEGTIQVNDPVKGCQTPPLRWVATAANP